MQCDRVSKTQRFRWWSFRWCQQISSYTLCRIAVRSIWNSIWILISCTTRLEWWPSPSTKSTKISTTSTPVYRGYYFPCQKQCIILGYIPNVDQSGFLNVIVIPRTLASKEVQTVEAVVQIISDTIHLIWAFRKVSLQKPNLVVSSI